MQKLPDLRGLKNQVIMPRESRNVYDHAMRALGVEVIEVNSAAELESAIGPRTAMIQILGMHFGSAKFGLAQVAPIAKKAGVPILVDAAADYLIVPNPYLALGRGSGGVQRRQDSARAAGRGIAGGTEGPGARGVGEQRAASCVRPRDEGEQGRDCRDGGARWRPSSTKRDLKAEFREWESWYAHITEQITQVPGVKTAGARAAEGRAVPDVEGFVGSGAGGVDGGRGGQAAFGGEPRIMSHASGGGNSFLIRPVAMKPDEYKVVAARLAEVFRTAPKGLKKHTPAPPSVDVAGPLGCDGDL